MCKRLRGTHLHVIHPVLTFLEPLRPDWGARSDNGEGAGEYECEFGSEFEFECESMWWPIIPVSSRSCIFSLLREGRNKAGGSVSQLQWKKVRPGKSELPRNTGRAGLLSVDSIG